MVLIVIIQHIKKIKLDLKPVLSLKARVTSVKEINKDDSVSYGRTYIADSNRKMLQYLLDMQMEFLDVYLIKIC